MVRVEYGIEFKYKEEPDIQSSWHQYGHGYFNDFEIAKDFLVKERPFRPELDFRLVEITIVSTGKVLEVLDI